MLDDNLFTGPTSVLNDICSLCSCNKEILKQINTTFHVLKIFEKRSIARSSLHNFFSKVHLKNKPDLAYV